MAAPDWLTERPIAHRGLHEGARAPENTRPAFQAAIDAGLPIELDVQLSSDGHPVVHHDAALGRLTAGSGSLRGHTLEQLTAMTVSGEQHRIMSLEQVLALVDGQVPLLVEVKSGDDAGLRAEAVARALEGYAGEAAVQSFDPAIVAWFRRNSPHIPRGQLSGRLSHAKGRISWVRRKALQHFALNLASRPDFLGYELAFLGTRKAAAFRSTGKPLLLWTVTNQQQRERAEQLGDNIIFEGFLP